MTTEILVNIGSGNGSLPGGTEPLPEPKLTNHQLGLVAFTWGQFHRKWSRYLSLMWIWKITNFELQPHLPGANEVMYVNSLGPKQNAYHFIDNLNYIMFEGKLAYLDSNFTEVSSCSPNDNNSFCLGDGLAPNCWEWQDLINVTSLIN